MIAVNHHPTERRVRAPNLRDPGPGGPSRSRVTAGVARIIRARAIAEHLWFDVFGQDSSALLALSRRIEKLSASDRLTTPQAAAELHQLATWMSAVTESIELEDDAAAELRPFLAVIIAECELIVSYDSAAAA